MNKSILKNRIFFFRNDLFPLIIIAVVFSGGCVAGAFFSCFIKESDPAVSYIWDIINSIFLGYDVFPNIIVLLLSTIKSHLLVFLLGYSALGVFFTPAVVAAKGFSLAFSVSLFIRVLGKNGICFTLLLFGVEAIFSIPLLFIITMLSLRMSACLFRSFKGTDSIDGINRNGLVKYFLLFLVILFLFVLLKKYIISLLLKYVIKI